MPLMLMVVFCPQFQILRTTVRLAAPLGSYGLLLIAIPSKPIDAPPPQKCCKSLASSWAVMHESA
jgi:CBS-domain-containing membrane protein